ncbi:unnamed protein product [Ostreobium quekettii]|uniref:Translation initiation factor IF-3 n=1 Tax=Ostreobium quekettii TaxID=121088 RepID=A0A8S1JBQ1_9CHLO|nr:unnamed protein product [Ostreobium quekettii]
MEWRSISKFARKQPPGEDVRINDRIFAPELRVVLPDGTHKIMRRVEALKLARFEQLDLVEVVPDVAPPVAKLMDFAKHVHAQRLGEKQIEKKIRLRAKLDSPKELRLSPKIADHDLEQKIQRMRDFLQKGQKVSVVVRFKGAAEERMAEEALNFVVATVSTEFKVTSETLPSTGRTKSVLLSPSPTADVGGRTTEQPVKQPVGTTAVQ